MRIARLLFLSAFVAAAASPLFAGTRGHHKGVSTKGSKLSSRRAAKPKLIGQRGIDDDRATQLQAALVKAGYLTGTPSGHWDSATEAAMLKLQADNGWQTKLVPDSRAIIKLGLGPSSISSTPAATPRTDLSASSGASPTGMDQ